MLHPFPSRRFTILCMACLFESLLAAAILLSLPSDPANGGLLGYSYQRLGLTGVGLLLAVFSLVVWLLSKKTRFQAPVQRMVMSKWVYFLFFSVLLAGLFMFMLYRMDAVFLTRISPVVGLAGLVCGQVILFQALETPGKAYWDEVFGWLDKQNVLFWLAIAASILLLFADAIRYEHPMGFAGLYTLMAEEIAAANFHLPVSVPFYGPGGVPFAYPPLGLYLMAVFLKLGVPAWTYLRYAPPALSLLALVPFYFLARRVTGSKLGALISTLLAAGSFFLFYMQTEAGGVVRGLAFGLGLTAIYFLERMLTAFRWRDAVLAGVFLGLTALSHLGYVYVFAFWAAAWMLTHPRKQNWIGAAVAAAVGILTALPWIISMAVRYGLSIFLYAFQTHGTGSFLSLLLTPARLFDQLKINLLCVYHDPLFLSLVLAGLILLLVRKKFTLPLLFLLIATIGFQGERSIMTVSFLVIGWVISEIYRYISTRKWVARHAPLEKLISTLLAVMIAVPLYYQAYTYLTRQEPLVNQGMLDAARYLRENTPSQSVYLSLFTSDVEEDEWFPYLTRREPLISVWGAEWLGSMEAQAGQLSALRLCVTDQSTDCLDAWLEEQRTQPDYLLMVSSLDQMAQALEQSGRWVNVYANASYTIWERR